MTLCPICEQPLQRVSENSVTCKNNKCPVVVLTDKVLEYPFIKTDYVNPVKFGG